MLYRAFSEHASQILNDPDGNKYRAAYFEHFPGIWRHGDWATLTDRGGMIIHGRSDATLNPGGVRIGTAEIYRQVEAFDEVLEALVIGQNWNGDTRVVLFVRLADDTILMTGCSRRSGPQSAPVRHRAMCRPRLSRCRIFRGPDRGRSPNSQCATSFMAGRSRTPKLWLMPTRWHSLPICQSYSPETRNP